MCLILFAWNAHPDYELVVAANRDEFHARPTAAASFWQDEPTVLAGRDLQAGGTWMGVSRNGRFAAITNYREPAAPEIPLERSRGVLVRDFLTSRAGPGVTAENLEHDGSQYRGFNLLLGHPGELDYVSNRGRPAETVAPGIHGLSNHLLNTDWPKIHEGRERLADIVERDDIDREALFALMTDRSPVGGTLPGGEVPRLAPEDLVRHYFIGSPVYGTRSTTVLLIGRNGRVIFEERRFNPQGEYDGVSAFEFERVL